MQPMGDVDLVIVGGGIGGSALAVVMARDGYSCLVLERTNEFPDRTRGEWLAAWGVFEARRLGVEDTLRSARGHVIKRHITYEPEVAPEESEANCLDLSALTPGVAGPMTQRHPDACQALFDAAASAGATCLRGVEDVRLDRSADCPCIAFTHEGARRTVRARLVVGADGRQSVIRRQCSLDVHTDVPHHLFSGLLVDDAPDFPEDLQVIGTTNDAHYLAFPQGGGRVRLYLGFSFDDRHRYTGEQGARQFLDAFDTPALPYASAIVGSTPVSPHAVYANEDGWVDTAAVEGVVLIGDAAGWNDPIIGQGLSITLRDVRIVTELLRESSDWSLAALKPYAEERRERMRRLRFSARVSSVLNNEFGPDAIARRIRARARLRENPVLGLVSAVAFIGPEHAPESVFTDATFEQILA